MKHTLLLAAFLFAPPLVSAQEIKLLPSDGAAQDRFGFSVAISGTTSIVGSFGHDHNGASSGCAYLFDTTTGTQWAELLPADGAAGDLFGRSVAIDGSTAVIGSPNDNGTGGVTQSGSAYLFDAVTGLQISKITASDAATNDYFGHAVAISGDTVLVTAYYEDAMGSNSGSAYLFDATTGMQLAKLVPSDGASEDFFGVSCAISGNIAIIGAYGDDDNGTDSGSAYLFDTTTGTQIAKLLPSDGGADDSFGFSVAISGPTAIVGAKDDDDNGYSSGSAYLFDTTTGTQTFKLLASDGLANDSFGISVAISDDAALVGAHRNDSNGMREGAAYLFDATTGLEHDKLVPSTVTGWDAHFGNSVGLDGGTAIIGADYENVIGLHSGSAYLMEACIGSVSNVCIGAINSRGLGAEMVYGGSTSVSANDFVLASVWCPYNQFGVFYYGPAQAQIPFGNGYRCVVSGGVGVFRLPVVNTGILGAGLWPLDITSPAHPSGQITAGSTWYFQFWYRDPLAGGATFNLSDALKVNFCS